MLTGGGSGGHITPILAVADEIKELSPGAELFYVGQKGDKLGDIPKQHMSITGTYVIRAGKFRRYHGQGIWQIFDLLTLCKNVRDAFYVVIGIIQAYRLLGRLKPAVVFVKGGFVGLPVGIAARFRHIPYVTHDSDALPGLTNRLLSKHASQHAVAMPKDLYNYPADKTVYLGVPIGAGYKPVNEQAMLTFRREIGLDGYKHILLVTGGGLGAQRINDAIIMTADKLLADYPELALVHIVGRKHELDVKKQYKKVLSEEQLKQVFIKGYITDLHRYSGAADVVVTRAGATALAEFATQNKPCIVIPNPYLTGGHQLKNIEPFAKSGAIRVVDEGALKTDPEKLLVAIRGLLASRESRNELSQNIATFAKPAAAKDLANLLLTYKSKLKESNASATKN